MNVRSEVVTQFVQVAYEHDKVLAPLTDDLEIDESGLDSLCLAVLVVRLEETLGIDPFTSETTAFPITFGDFVSIYENAAS